MNTFQVNPAPAAATIDAEYLQLDPYLYQLLTGTTITGQSSPPPPAAALYGDPPAAPYATWETSLASVPTFLQQTGIQTTDLIALLQTRFANPGYPLGQDRTIFNELPFGYSTLMALVHADFNTSDRGGARRRSDDRRRPVRRGHGRRLHPGLVGAEPEPGPDTGDLLPRRQLRHDRCVDQPAERTGVPATPSPVRDGGAALARPAERHRVRDAAGVHPAVARARLEHG